MWKTSQPGQKDTKNPRREGWARRKKEELEEHTRNLFAGLATDREAFRTRP
jgi:hypothetical protein